MVHWVGRHLARVVGRVGAGVAEGLAWGWGVVDSVVWFCHFKNRPHLRRNSKGHERTVWETPLEMGTLREATHGRVTTSLHRSPLHSAPTAGFCCERNSQFVFILAVEFLPWTHLWAIQTNRLKSDDSCREALVPPFEDVKLWKYSCLTTQGE